MTAWLERIVLDRRTEQAIIVLIVINAVVLGLETSPSIMASYGPLLHILDQAILAVFVIEIGATSNLFEEGHRIRLQVTSSCFPEFSRNLNSGAPIGLTTEMVRAEQTILHDAEHPSALILPVIPQSPSEP